MKRTLFCLASLMLFSLFTPSCAYLQTHKNVKEIGAEYDGFILEKPSSIYRQGNQWYISAQQCKMQKEYPILHDNIMFTQQNQEPQYYELHSSGNKKTVYIPISGDTAHVLQQSDGYFTKNVLLQEISSNVDHARAELTGKSAYAVRAEIEGEQRTLSLEATRTPKTPGVGLTALSWVDRIVIDWPGTLAYNVCIPFMAPFFFFSDFLSDN